MGIRTSFSAMEALGEKRSQDFWPDPVMSKLRSAEKRYRQVWLSETDRKIASLESRINNLFTE